jgi:hypothetical protein
VVSDGNGQAGQDGLVPAFAATLPRPVEDRSWGPTILLCVAVLLAAVIVVVAKPLSAAAASPHHHVHLGARRAGARHAQDVSQVTTPSATSPNWSGYVSYAPIGNDDSFDQVSAEWTEPKVSCPKKNAWTLFWVGFDGWPSTDRSVEQGGTSAQCVDGVPRYSAFYEMWPTDAVTTMFPIDAGDQIEAGVVYSSTTNDYLITVTDLSTSPVESMTETEPCPTTCARTSAEWIAESPAHFGTSTWFPLANYGTINFTSATATNTLVASPGPISNPSVWSATSIERVAGAAQPVAKVFGLENIGDTSSFSDEWKRR